MTAENTPPAGFNPPTTPGGPGESTMFDLPEPQGWPKPMGITSLVIAGLNIGCIGCAGIGIAMQSMFAEFAAEQFPDGMPPSASSVSFGMIGALTLGGVVEAVLVAAGVMLLMRRAVARPLYLVYTVLALLSFVVSTIVQVQAQVEMTEWIKANSTTKFAQQQQATGWIGQVIGWSWGLLFGFCWPVFCGVWFGMIKKKASDITEGVAEVV